MRNTLESKEGELESQSDAEKHRGIDRDDCKRQGRRNPRRQRYGEETDTGRGFLVDRDP